ncbi:hypothetical protein ACVWYH_007225 [Bradyrhizobium sp. GM24.11]
MSAAWLCAKLALISQKIKLAEAIRYALSRWQGLTRFIDDGCIELDNNTVERSIRGIELSRKNALFAGSDGGAEHWAVVASLVETCKLNDVDPLAYLTDVLTRIVNGHPNRDIDQLLPWAYRAQALKALPENDAYELCAEPPLEGFRQRPAFLLSNETALLGAAASDVLLDGIELGDMLKRLARNGRRARCGKFRRSCAAYATSRMRAEHRHVQRACHSGHSHRPAGSP